MMNSSHQDIAWVDRPEVCIIMRDTMLLTPIIKDAFARPDYGFDIEDGLMLREYIERHPDAQEKIAELLNRKLLSVGATYNCPYEDMYGAEDLVRQLYLGKLWVKKNFRRLRFQSLLECGCAGKNHAIPSNPEKGRC